jgi:hypothetical protein
VTGTTRILSKKHADGFMPLRAFYFISAAAAIWKIAFESDDLFLA